MLSGKQILVFYQFFGLHKLGHKIHDVDVQILMEVFVKLGVLGTLAVIEASRSAGIKLMIGGMVETRLAMGFASHYWIRFFQIQQFLPLLGLLQKKTSRIFIVWCGSVVRVEIEINHRRERFLHSILWTASWDLGNDS
ncbi:hypothetical protein KSP39_PZI015942 [Platanthera zijinensis]|uniref:Uncharacterized protein n=1 Tax=Platanthera zijinensis TaxID=2320716 RepID=A0AAP0G1G3_9ASPA